MIPLPLSSSLLSHGGEKTLIAVNPDQLKCSDHRQSPRTSSCAQGTLITEISSPKTISGMGADVESPSAHCVEHAPTETPSRSMSPSEYTALAGQFSTFVLISTFTATFIVSFLGLARDIVNQPTTPDPTALFQFDVGMFLGMSATGLHIGIIVVGGRAAALCFRLAARSPRNEIDVEANRVEELSRVNFYRYVRYCDHLQLLASTILLIFFLFLVHAMFAHKVFFWLLLGLSAMWGLYILNTGFWRVSVSVETIRDAWSWFGRCCARRT